MALKFLPIEKAAAVYCAATSLLMVIMMPRLVDPVGMALMRVEWLAMTFVLALLFSHRSPLTAKHSPITSFLRTVAQLAWLILWYPDTYEFNRCFANLDHVFAAADQQLFGCQPALEFSQLLPGAVWSEAFCLGYWSYFPMIALLSLAVLYKYRVTSEKSSIINHQYTPFSLVTTTLLAAFFLFYLIYIFLPVAGPQFYFHAVGVDEIVQGHFPALGTYFSSHTDMLPSPGYSDGVFYHLVSSAQATGERPTAAFPSSHIGISTIVLILARRHVPRLLIVLLPLWILLCCATVYIQAHYVVDAIAGLLSAPLILWLASRLIAPLWSSRRAQ